LRAHLRCRTKLVETLVPVGDATYRIAHPAAADALIDEEDFARDERLPYWAELWPSAMALAAYLSKEELTRRRAIELGCGLGLPTIVALAHGSEVTATDHYQAALDFSRYNARTNLAREPETQLLDWRTPETGSLGGSFDLVLAADILYEPRNIPALAALIPALLAPGGEVLLADPRRKNTPKFAERMRTRGLSCSTEERLVPSDGRGVTVLVHRFE
jgi:predicted nicotinamide N-methyase